MTRVALFVDDEPRILDGLRRGLRGLRHDWELRFALGGEAGRDALSGDVDVVVSDMRMPEVDGIDVLLAARDRAPRAARVVLSGHSDRQASLRAAGIAHRFVSKPCDAAVLQDLLPALADAAGPDVSGPGALLSGPDAVGEVRLLAERLAPEDAIARAVLRDPALTLKVLQVAGSSFFVPGRRVLTVQEAVAHLGASVLLQLVDDPSVTCVAGTADELRLVAAAEALRLDGLPERPDDVEATRAALRALRPLLPGPDGSTARLMALWGVAPVAA